jgi:hypothetical protein
MILFDKLEHYCIRGLVLHCHWIKNYFVNRFQFVVYNGVQSCFNETKCGVPQGSILGPLFFLLCVNDPCFEYQFDLVLFADNTHLFFTHNDPIKAPL